MAGGGHVLFISIDCMRADCLREDITPEICKLGEKGTLYTSAYANGCGTPDSFPSLFASRHAKPFAGPEPFDPDLEYSLQPADVTLAEVLASASYETAAFVGGNPYLGEKYGYNRGFGLYKDHQPGALVDRITGGRARGALRKMAARLPWSPYASAQQVTDEAIRWLNSRGNQSSYFIWVHYMDAHFPTLPPSHLSLRERRAAWSPITGGAQRHHDLIVRLYKESLRFIDAEVGRLLSLVMASTIVVVTADHGQLLGEHSSYWHNGVWEQLLRVPLVIAGPEVGPGVVDETVQLLDLSPELIKMLGLDAPERWSGDQLRATSEPIYAVSNCPVDRTYTEALIGDRWKIIRTPENEWKYEREAEPPCMMLV